jgi:hypothetical protein
MILLSQVESRRLPQWLIVAILVGVAVSMQIDRRRDYSRSAGGLNGLLRNPVNQEHWD